MCRTGQPDSPRLNGSGSMAYSAAHSAASRATSSRRPVVVTGWTAICPLGNTLEALWQGLITGTSGVCPLTMFSTEGLSLKFAAEARQFANDDITNFGELDK